MKVTNHDGRPLRRVIGGLMFDTEVLAQVAPVWEPDCLGPPAPSLVGQWCVDFYKAHGKAPGVHVEDEFQQWFAAGRRDEDTAANVEAFIKAAEKEFAGKKKAHTPAYLIDLTLRQIRKGRIEKVMEEAKLDLEMGRVDEADARFSTYRPVQTAGEGRVDFGGDDGLVERVFARRATPLVKYKGPIGDFLNPALYQGAFITFVAREKGGKSLMLMDLAWRACFQGHQVAFFETGDQTEPELNARMLARCAKRPFFAGSYRYPLGVEEADRDAAVPDFDERHEAEDLSPDAAKAAYAKVRKKWGGPRLFQSFHPAGTLTVPKIAATLDAWERRDDFRPACVIVDYADLLAPTNTKQEVRHQINEIWYGLRRVSQERKVLLATATQANREAYNARVITMSHASEEKRKWGHVTAAFGLNRTPGEQGAGTMRVNIPVARGFGYDPSKVVYVAGCPELAWPVIHSCH